ncbi:MAG: TraR/DksA C4-type zinc finger protein [Minisyncoccota bacterium]
MALDVSLLAELKEKLLNEKTHLEAELGRFAKPTGARGDYETQMEDIGRDSDDQATEVEGYVDNLGLESNLEGQLRDVNDALDKMEQGVYGLCETSGQEISAERLRAYPAARTAL